MSEPGPSVYRQAAIVVASLERQVADDLLERMPEDQSQAIRDELVLLEDWTDDEQSCAIRDYLTWPYALNLEADSRHDAQYEQDVVVPLGEMATEERSSTPIVCELLTLDDAAIAVAIKHERSSIVTALLYSLPKKRAAAVLRLLPANLQWRVLTNINRGVVTRTDLVDVIADCICDNQIDRLQGDSTQGSSDALQAIFRELNAEEQHEMVRSLAKENPMLAQRLVPIALDSLSPDCYC